MRVAYLILAHNKPAQLARLVASLPETVFIHYDARAKDYDEARRAVLSVNPNAVFVKRHVCRWGAPGIMYATLELIRAALRKSFDYATLLSGSDYPIKSLEYIAHDLRKGGEYIETFAVREPNKWSEQTGHFNAVTRMEGRYFRFRSHVRRFGTRKMPNGIIPYGGSQWWTLSRAALETVDRADPSLIKFCAGAFIPDEHFMQTILGNSPIMESIVSDDLRFAIWDRPEPPFPATLRSSDLSALAASPCHFARKFDDDPSLFDAIDALRQTDRVLVIPDKEQPSRMSKRLLMVTPPVVIDRNGSLEIDPHFENNIAGYLTRVDHVTIACTPAKVTAGSGISNSIPVEQSRIADRFTLIALPECYREDRYLRNRWRVSKLLEAEIDKADYLTFAPHAPFDWPTLAAKITMSKGRRYDVEADWDMRQVTTAIWSAMKPGPRKWRQRINDQRFFRDLDRIMAGSSLAMLQGADVFNAYREIAPNPRKVLNIQVTKDDLISEMDLARKLKEIRSGEPLRIIYTGRATHMKGPLDWLETLKRLHDGTDYDHPVKFHATWYGDGDMLNEMRAFVAEHRLGDCVSLPGSVSRDEVLSAMRQAHVFLFCHLTLESPRCIVESLASATPVVGYGTLYTRDLVGKHGGGEFVPMGFWQGLAQSLVDLNKDRDRLAKLVEGARETSRHFDRDAAIRERIDLIVEAA